MRRERRVVDPLQVVDRLQAVDLLLVVLEDLLLVVILLVVILLVDLLLVDLLLVDRHYRHHFQKVVVASHRQVLLRFLTVLEQELLVLKLLILH